MQDTNFLNLFHSFLERITSSDANYNYQYIPFNSNFGICSLVGENLFDNFSDSQCLKGECSVEMAVRDNNFVGVKMVSGGNSYITLLRESQLFNYFFSEAKNGFPGFYVSSVSSYSFNGGFEDLIFFGDIFLDSKREVMLPHSHIKYNVPEYVLDSVSLNLPQVSGNKLINVEVDCIVDMSASLQRYISSRTNFEDCQYDLFFPFYAQDGSFYELDDRGDFFVFTREFDTGKYFIQVRKSLSLEQVDEISFLVNSFSGWLELSKFKILHCYEINRSS